MASKTEYQGRTRYDVFLGKVKNNVFFIPIIALTAFVAGIGIWAGTGKQLIEYMEHFSSPIHDPYTFKYKDQIIRFGCGTGISLKRAIVIEGALTSDAGIEAEHQWLSKFYPDYVVEMHSSIEKNGRNYSAYYLRHKKREISKTIYFDDTSYFGTPSSDLVRDDLRDAYVEAINKALKTLKNQSLPVTIRIPAQKWKYGDEIIVTVEKKTLNHKKNGEQAGEH